jgi:hypothetical protein
VVEGQDRWQGSAPAACESTGSQVTAMNEDDPGADDAVKQEMTDAVVEPHHPPDADPVVAAGLPGEGKRRSTLTDEERRLLVWIETEDRHARRQTDPAGCIDSEERDRTQPVMRTRQATGTLYTVAVTFTVPAESYDYLLSPAAIQREFQMWLKSLGAAVHTVTVTPGDEKEMAR